MDFEAFPKIARLSREIIITEKIDGSNAQVYIEPTVLTEGYSDAIPVAVVGDYQIYAGSRSRWVVPGKNDNYGFAGWVAEHAEELVKLGPGRHYGEWWGRGINRNYGLQERRFSLFNVTRWDDDLIRPECCHVVPTLTKVNQFDTGAIDFTLAMLAQHGSAAARGFMNPEGIVVYHPQGNVLFKKTIKNDEMPKGKVKDAVQETPTI